MLVRIGSNIRDELLRGEGKKPFSAATVSFGRMGPAENLQTNVLAFETYSLEVVICDLVGYLGECWDNGLDST
jgi:hypothetical protein